VIAGEVSSKAQVFGAGQ